MSAKKVIDDIAELVAEHKADPASITLEDRRRLITILQAVEGVLKEACPHELSGLEDDSTVYCTVCRRTFGWYCSESPDKQCHYKCEIDEGKIELMDGSLHEVSVGDQHYWESCIFCGNPEERK